MNQGGWTGSRGHVAPRPHLPSVEVPGPGWWHLRGLGPQDAVALRPGRLFLLPFNSHPVAPLPPAAPSASPFQDSVPLMAPNFLHFSSRNLFMASVYFLFLCQVLLLDLLPPQRFPCPYLFIESNLFFFFFVFLSPPTEPFRFLLNFSKT